MEYFYFFQINKIDTNIHVQFKSKKEVQIKPIGKMGVGIALGVAIGAATDNLAVGIGIGVALGAAMSQLKN